MDILSLAGFLSILVTVKPPSPGKLRAPWDTASWELCQVFWMVRKGLLDLGELQLLRSGGCVASAEWP